jgi:lactoylglutathione lyase
MNGEAPVPVRGLFETHLTVADLDRSIQFYRDVVGLPPALELRERGAAFFWIGEPGAAMLGLWSMGSMPVFGEDTDEPSVIGWMPAAAVYFKDPDGHLLEYLAMLDESPRPDTGIVSWSEWTREAGGDAPYAGAGSVLAAGSDRD